VSLTAAFGTAFQRQVQRAASRATNLRELASDASEALSFCTTVGEDFFPPIDVVM
jgi:hypothetical protein